MVRAFAYKILGDPGKIRKLANNSQRSGNKASKLFCVWFGCLHKLLRGCFVCLAYDLCSTRGVLWSHMAETILCTRPTPWKSTYQRCIQELQLLNLNNVNLRNYGVVYSTWRLCMSSANRTDNDHNHYKLFVPVIPLAVWKAASDESAVQRSQKHASGFER